MRQWFMASRQGYPAVLESPGPVASRSVSDNGCATGIFSRVLNDYYWPQTDYRDFPEQSGFSVQRLDEPLAEGDDMP